MQFISPLQQTSGLDVDSMSARIVFDSIPHAIILLAPSGVIQYANSAAENLFNQPLLNKSWALILSQNFQPRADDGHEISLKNGRRVKVEINALPNGYATLITLTDLTETRALQQNVAQLQKLSSLGTMMASMAHQIRTPLSAALLYASNLANTHLKPEMQHKFQTKLLSRLMELERQVEDMLLFSKGKNKSPESFTNDQLLASLEQQVDAVVQQSQIRFTVLNDTEWSLLGDLGGLSSALANAVINAIEAKATAVECRFAIEQGNLCITITDNGEGMAKEKLANAFDPFETNKPQGTGLGLAVLFSVVKNHHGAISLWSEPQQGFQVKIIMPITGALHD
ncbi:nitrogen regulation protein NR(II) [Paraferrimonas sp. SM1919]|uniref:two-component system sensor histidine kinase NtrB n=1 Tax=Paraferrimonas sp. SM1919 TaxID=2662263 RepID=UPI0013D312F8|nr:ATP-binding protein [Paraferrimonas sp. SM1919]